MQHYEQLEDNALKIIYGHSKDYSSHFENLDRIIDDYKQEKSNVEIVSILVTMRKSVKTMFALTEDLFESNRLKDDEELLSKVKNETLQILNQLVIANMQLRNYNSLFNDNASQVQNVCEHQCWFASVAVMLTLEIGGDDYE